MNKRSANFSSKEVKVLLELVDKHRNIIECDKTDRVSWKDKSRAWKDVEKMYNAKYKERFRSAKVLKTKYDNIKKTAKRIKREKANESSLSIFTPAVSLDECNMVNICKPEQLMNWPLVEEPLAEEPFENDSIEIIDTNNSPVANSFVDSDTVISGLGIEEDEIDDASALNKRHTKSTHVLEKVIEEKMNKFKLKIKCEEEEHLLRKAKLQLEMRCIEEEHALKLKKLNLEIETLNYRNEILKRRF